MKPRLDAHSVGTYFCLGYLSRYSFHLILNIFHIFLDLLSLGQDFRFLVPIPGSTSLKFGLARNEILFAFFYYITPLDFQ